MKVAAAADTVRIQVAIDIGFACIKFVGIAMGRYKVMTLIVNTGGGPSGGNRLPLWGSYTVCR